MNDSSVTFTFQKQTPQRLDKFLVDCLPDFSRSRLQQLIKDHLVFVDGEPARKAGLMLEGETIVEVQIPPVAPSELQPEAIPLEIIFENEDVMVVNKPAGMVVHPAAGHASGTLVHAALAHAPDIEGVGGVQRPGIVHRLDKDTSGIILLAKNDRAHQWLQKQFHDRMVKKTYFALVDGHPPTPVGRVEAAIGRDPNQRKRMAVMPDHKGRAAVTEYRTLQSFPEHTLIEAHPVTGRTHQIRVHLAFLGCPIVGDAIYGRRKSSLSIQRHFLHAGRIQIILPGEATPRVFEAELPAELQAVLESLGNK